MKAAEVLLRELFGPPVVDANTVEAQDLQQYTEQQIDEHCKDLERCMKLKGAIAETSYLPISIRIIRQLQGVTKRHG